jgi:hypothetical protein
VPRSPVAPPEGRRIGKKESKLKNGRPKGTVKAVWQKTGMALKKIKIKKKEINQTQKVDII